MFCDVTVCDRLMTVEVKAMHTARKHNVLPDNSLRDVYICIMTKKQASDVVTFDFKGTGVLCVVCGANGYQMNFFLVHYLLSDQSL